MKKEPRLAHKVRMLYDRVLDTAELPVLSE